MISTYASFVDSFIRIKERVEYNTYNFVRQQDMRLRFSRIIMVIAVFFAIFSYFFEWGTKNTDENDRNILCADWGQFFNIDKRGKAEASRAQSM